MFIALYLFYSLPTFLFNIFYKNREKLTILRFSWIKFFSWSSWCVLSSDGMSVLIWIPKRQKVGYVGVKSGTPHNINWFLALKPLELFLGGCEKREHFSIRMQQPPERERSKIFNAAKKRKLNLHKNLQLKPQQQQKIHNHLHTSFHLFSFEWKIGAGNISICLLSINIHSWVVYLIVLNEHWENESRKKHKF